MEKSVYNWASGQHVGQVASVCDLPFEARLTGDATRQYTWDGENRLAVVAPAASPVAGDTRLTFAYDYVGRRVRKQVETYSGTYPNGSWNVTAVRKFLWDGPALDTAGPPRGTGRGATAELRSGRCVKGALMLLEYDGLAGGTGVPPVIRKYTWGLDLAGQSGASASGRSALRAAGGIGGLLAVLDTNGTPDNPNDDLKYAYFYDANGNVGQVVDIIVAYAGGCYIDMNHCRQAPVGAPEPPGKEQVIRFCEKHPGPGGHYRAWMWCVTCKACEK